MKTLDTDPCLFSVRVACKLATWDTLPARVLALHIEVVADGHLLQHSLIFSGSSCNPLKASPDMSSRITRYKYHAKPRSERERSYINW